MPHCPTRRPSTTAAACPCSSSNTREAGGHCQPRRASTTRSSSPRRSQRPRHRDLGCREDGVPIGRQHHRRVQDVTASAVFAEGHVPAVVGVFEIQVVQGTALVASDRSSADACSARRSVGRRSHSRRPCRGAFPFADPRCLRRDASLGAVDLDQAIGPARRNDSVRAPREGTSGWKTRTDGKADRVLVRYIPTRQVEQIWLLLDQLGLLPNPPMRAVEFASTALMGTIQTTTV